MIYIISLEDKKGPWVTGGWLYVMIAFATKDKLGYPHHKAIKAERRRGK